MLSSGYTPHAAQAEFHRTAKRFAVLAAGARGGKTHAAAREFLDRIYRKDRPTKTGPLHYWAAAPTYSLGKVMLREIFLALGGQTSPFIRRYGKADREMELIGDVTVEFKTTDRTETLVAVGLDGLWLDEAARAKPDAWLGGLSMRLSDRAGWALFSTTPLGRNWFFDHLVKPAIRGDEGHSFHTWHSTANTAAPALAAEVERQRLVLPAPYFRREYEASFDAFIGQIYEDFDLGLHIVSDPPDNVKETRYGVDWGFRNPGAILALQLDGADCWHVVDEEVHTGVLVDGDSAATWVKLAKAMVARHGDGIFYCDPSAPANIAALRRAGLKPRAANNEVAPGILSVAKAIKPLDNVPGIVVHRGCKTTIDELTTYRWNERAGGEVPLKENDHTCDALRYALHTSKHTPAYW